MATTLTRDGGGCSGGHVIYLSPYYPPPPCARVSAFSLPLFTSYLLRQLHRVAPSWALPLSPPLRPSFLLSRSGSVVVSIARGNRDSLPPLPHPPPLFLFVSPIFRLLPQRLHSALPLYPPTSLLLSLCPLSSSFFHYFSSVLTECLEYFGNYSGRFRVCFFIPKRNISRSYYSPFPFRVLL